MRRRGRNGAAHRNIQGDWRAVPQSTYAGKPRIKVCPEPVRSTGRFPLAVCCYAAIHSCSAAESRWSMSFLAASHASGYCFAERKRKRITNFKPIGSAIRSMDSGSTKCDHGDTLQPHSHTRADVSATADPYAGHISRPPTGYHRLHQSG